MKNKTLNTRQLAIEQMGDRILITLMESKATCKAVVRDATGDTVVQFTDRIPSVGEMTDSGQVLAVYDVTTTEPEFKQYLTVDMVHLLQTSDKAKTVSVSDLSIGTQRQLGLIHRTRRAKTENVETAPVGMERVFNADESGING